MWNSSRTGVVKSRVEGWAGCPPVHMKGDPSHLLSLLLNFGSWSLDSRQCHLHTGKSRRLHHLYAIKSFKKVTFSQASSISSLLLSQGAPSARSSLRSQASSTKSLKTEVLRFQATEQFYWRKREVAFTLSSTGPHG